MLVIIVIAYMNVTVSDGYPPHYILQRRRFNVGLACPKGISNLNVAETVEQEKTYRATSALRARSHRDKRHDAEVTPVNVEQGK